MSQELNEIFGPKGRHVRSEVGVLVLPMNVPVAVDLVVNLENEVLI